MSHKTNRSDFLSRLSNLPPVFDVSAVTLCKFDQHREKVTDLSDICLFPGERVIFQHIWIQSFGCFAFVCNNHNKDRICLDVTVRSFLKLFMLQDFTSLSFYWRSRFLTEPNDRLQEVSWPPDPSAPPVPAGLPPLLSFFFFLNTFPLFSTLLFGPSALRAFSTQVGRILMDLWSSTRKTPSPLFISSVPSRWACKRGACAHGKWCWHFFVCVWGEEDTNPTEPR